MLFGRRLREIRRQQGISLSEFARLTGFSASYASAVERGLKKPTPSFICRAGGVLKVSTAYLESLAEDAPEWEQVRELRENRGLSVADLAEISGVPAETIKRIEAGQVLPTAEEIKKLAEALNYPLELPLAANKGFSPVSLGWQIRKTRCEQGLSVTEFAEKAGVSPGLISQIEGGYTVPLLETLEAIARCLNVSLASLLTEENNVDSVLAGLDEETRRALGDPKVQALLCALRDCDAREFWFVLEFIAFFIRQKNIHTNT